MSAKNCECCIMPLSTESKSGETDSYCRYCFVDGKLLAENMSLAAFKKKSYEGMVKRGMNKMKAWFFSQFIGMAPYWKNKKRHRK